MPRTTAKPVNVRMAMGALTPLRRQFIEWMTDPTIPKPPGSERAWAKQHGLSEYTLKGWKKEPAFRRAWEARTIQVSLTPDKIARLIDWSFNRVIENDDRHLAIALLGFLRKWTPGATVEIRPHGDVRFLSDDELRALVEKEQTVGQKGHEQHEADSGHRPDAATPAEGRLGGVQNAAGAEEVELLGGR